MALHVAAPVIPIKAAQFGRLTRWSSGRLCSMDRFQANAMIR